MLVLTRKQGEKITIGPDVVVTIVKVSGKCVRVGIEAPQDVAVHRKEFADALADKQRHWAQMSPAYDVEI